MKYAYFPGCCYHTSAKEYELSTRVVARNLGLNLMEIPDWSCCGSTAAHSKNHLLSLALPARNLALAEEMGLDVTAPCAACFQRLAAANVKMADDQALREKINQITGKDYHGTVKVKSMVEVMNSLDPGDIRDQVALPLKGLKVAAYYGCFLVRPPWVTRYDDPENPTSLDRLMRLAGAESVEWPHKTECCGASLSISSEEIVLRLVNKILLAAQKSGANCLVTACPLCHFNLDLRQQKCNKQLGTQYNLPVFYFTQLLGVAMGLDHKALCLDTHFMDTAKILKQVG